MPWAFAPLDLRGPRPSQWVEGPSQSQDALVNIPLDDASVIFAPAPITIVTDYDHGLRHESSAFTIFSKSMLYSSSMSDKRDRYKYS